MRFTTKTLKKIVIFTTIFVILNIQFAACAPAADTSQFPISRTAIALKTVVTITVFDEDHEPLIAECVELCEYYEKIFSRTREDSELYQLNAAGEGEVSDELLEVLELALYFCEASGGALDITTGALSDLYAFGTENAGVPSDADLDEALAHVNYKNVEITGNYVKLLDPLAVLDLGAIAKGYIADRLGEFLAERGVESAIIDLGGNIVVLGTKPDGSDYLAGIQFPFEGRDHVITAASVSNTSVVTSGVYERFFIHEDKIYHHILNPQTGYPFENSLLAVSVITPSSAAADALSTSCFALGLEAGMALIESMDDAFAVFITDDFALHYSSGFEDAFIK